MVEFTVPGEPQPWRRARLGKGVWFVDDKTRAWQDTLRCLYVAAAGDLAPTMAPVRVEVRCYFKAPARLLAKKREQATRQERIVAPKRPDADNLAKCVLDALNGVAYLDDAQVVELVVIKRYSLKPRTEVAVSPMLDDTEAFATKADVEYLYPRRAS